MRSVRTHTKSRTGCKSCRKRKVKCDEQTPVCTNCTKRQIECVWSDTKPHQSSSPQSSISALSIPFLTGDQDLTSGTCNFTLDLMALELMHHYTDSTCCTMSLEPAALHVWKTIVPTLAFSANCTFLLHGLLSISALHLYSLHGSNNLGAKYAYAASSYHAQAKNSLPSVSMLPPGVSPSVIYMTESFLTAYTYLVSPSLWESLDSMATVRYKPQVAMSKNKTYTSPEFFPLVNEYRAMDAAVSLHLASDMQSEPHFPASLLSIHLPNLGAPEPEEVCDPDVSALYERIVRNLRRTWVASLYPQYHKQAAVLWFITMPDAFMKLLVERRPRALVLASHYCAIMRRLKEPWWTRRKWTEEMEHITNIVGEEWRPWMDWVPPDDGVFGHLELEEGTSLYAWLSNCSPIVDTMLSNGNN